ncbi:hypothetical protein [Paraglaciecola polaris]|uniref:Uncharacterized protein n=1 Tax=Paraglaciecola polaris LMG 21857 TaxID=1129793 RepID=K6ZG21_9ALTE|nr:hypothetical protein [Paraglaciecola polaris]GAC34996.1 hypothetical protein GPLA_4117 [Paraglaciecola polaris LMG 21857]
MAAVVSDDRCVVYGMKQSFYGAINLFVSCASENTLKTFSFAFNVSLTMYLVAHFVSELLNNDVLVHMLKGQ